MSAENSEQVVISGRMWALIWGIVLGSIAVFVWLVFQGAMGNDDQRYYYLEVPGSMELPHLSPGRYTIFHDFDKSRDSKEDLRPAGFERIAFTVTPINGGPGPSVVEAQSKTRFVIRRTVCESKLQFDVTEPGGYRINGDYDSGQTGGTYRVVIGKPYFAQALRNFIIGTVLLIFAGIAVSYLLYRSGAVRPAPPTAAP